MNEEKSKPEEMKRQLWEPAGVISVTDQPGMDYGRKSHDIKKEGQLTLEVEDAFHNKGLMEKLPENTPKTER